MAKEKLFIERSISMLQPCGRMAIVLPRGILKNYSDERIRRYILKNAKILGVVGLGGNMFKPFTNTKTVVLFIQKRFKPYDNIEQCHFADEKMKLVFCVTEKSGKDKTGKIVTDEAGAILSDLPEITDYLIDNIKYMSEQELKNEYERAMQQTSESKGVE